MNATELLTIVNPDELTLEFGSLMAWEIGAVNNANDAAQYMYKGGPYLPQASIKKPKTFKLSEGDDRPNKKYWDFVKQEMYSFICEENPKYNELWDRIGKLESKSTNALILIISGYIGEKAGVQGSVLAGFVGVCLYGFVKISKESYCEYIRNKNA